MKAVYPTCPCCGQPISAMRFGVMLRPLQVRFIDAIVRAGADGLTGRDLKDVIWGAAETSHAIVAVYAHQINDMLMSTDVRIVCGRGKRYRIGRVQIAEVA
jgi:hypothetical protein